eukprot:3664473-Rhodomonas_salina.2
MQPPIEPGQSMDIFFSCRSAPVSPAHVHPFLTRRCRRKLVELKVVKQFGQPPSDVDPSAFVSSVPLSGLLRPESTGFVLTPVGGTVR